MFQQPKPIHNMWKFSIIFVVLFSFAFLSSVLAQEPVKLSKPRLELIDNYINIFYDIFNTDESVKFKIWVEITDSTGNKVDARALSGDIGENVSGGNDKKITWDLTTDSIYPDAGVYIQINAEIIRSSKRISRSGVCLKSLAFPGWGLTSMNKSKLHWLKGVAGYGCITAAVVYNKKAISSYNDYLIINDLNEADTYYDNSVKYDNLSEIFAYTAIGIWVTDFIWTVAGSSNMNNEPGYAQAKGFSIKTVYEPWAQVPMVALRYNF